ncbi:hypothetical protein [Reichenbachiella ulvae]|uniref:Transposase IS200-like domain-containing protein n=1 Tax=Reichenbachiella ulvae TaxID=2980104 RepID=A0ABT3CZ74_9BACT|nr:hypothetical protein [Reichenbachiella ulvae]MCV9388513.1 hypothetical protein [Reichenbachiella ulvae]
MKANTNLLEPEKFYHIYNRGINGENIFKEQRNYYYFLKLFEKFITPITETFAYCLLPNHFHFFIKTLPEEMIKSSKFHRNQNIQHFLGNQFAKAFNSYTQALNKSINRTGSLFEHPFRRKTIDSNDYISKLIWYIHFNPQKHKLTKDFKDYPFSSYQSILSSKSTNLKRYEVIEWFGGIESFKTFHEEMTEQRTLDESIFNFD